MHDRDRDARFWPAVLYLYWDDAADEPDKRGGMLPGDALKVGHAAHVRQRLQDRVLKDAGHLVRCALLTAATPLARLTAGHRYTALV